MTSTGKETQKHDGLEFVALCILENPVCRIEETKEEHNNTTGL